MQLSQIRHVEVVENGDENVSGLCNQIYVHMIFVRMYVYMYYEFIMNIYHTYTRVYICVYDKGKTKEARARAKMTNEQPARH